MKLRTFKQELEEYFSKTYTEKYIEFGSYFYEPSMKALAQSPMQKYFTSGKYKELNDPKLESLWKEIKKRELYKNIFVLGLIILFYILNRE